MYILCLKRLLYIFKDSCRGYKLKILSNWSIKVCDYASKRLIIILLCCYKIKEPKINKYITM